jgi:membrane protein DedA with SNARE-associated domain
VFSSDFWHAALIFGSALVLEDVAILTAALLVANSMVSLPWAAAASFAGIWFGDLGLYFIARHYGRPVLDRTWFKRLVSRKLDLRRSEAWFQDHGTAAIVISRAIPGTRLPTYLAAGLLKIPASRFVLMTALACAIWVTALFGFSYHVGMMAISGFRMFRSEAGKLVACVVMAAVLIWPLRKLFERLSIDSLIARFKRILRWEFWPPALFYIPVVAKCLMLAIKYRSLTLPTLANPGMYLGGLIGESKFDTLAVLAEAHPDVVAETRLVPFDCVERQVTQILRLRDAENLAYPLVLKPDVGQRGFGFRVIHSDEEVKAYVKHFARDVLVQEYAPGPHEAGVFYYRFPHQDKGKIFSITDKVFPLAVGDGERTLEELIRRDPRASLISEVYLKRFHDQRKRVLAAGEVLRLVEAGNHCQGAIFLDGQRLFSPALESKIDEISKSIRGFYIGRYDLRYASEEALREGRGVQIVEINGVSSEATSIYDPKNSLCDAYRVLFRQWEIIFAIADENRARGLRPIPIGSIWGSWTRCRREPHSIPQARERKRHERGRNFVGES